MCILVAILKTQDGCHLKWILVVTAGSFLILNMGLNTKIIALCRLKNKLVSKMCILVVVLKMV